MGVGINETRQHNFTLAIHLNDFLAIPFEPEVLERVFRLSHRDDLAAHRQNRSIFDDTEFSKLRATAGTRIFPAQCKKLANVDQEQRTVAHQLSLFTSTPFADP